MKEETHKSNENNIKYKDKNKGYFVIPNMQQYTKHKEYMEETWHPYTLEWWENIKEHAIIIT